MFCKFTIIRTNTSLLIAKIYTFHVSKHKSRRFELAVAAECAVQQQVSKSQLLWKEGLAQPISSLDCDPAMQTIVLLFQAQVKLHVLLVNF